ncbi:MAG: IS110 family transposase, partial [Chloroflexota bacterium]
LRRILYMPAIVAMKHNPIIRDLAQRLEKEGKPKKVIICAAMRKLLHIAFGVIKHRIPFDPTYSSKLQITP